MPNTNLHGVGLGALMAALAAANAFAEDLAEEGTVAQIVVTGAAQSLTQPTTAASRLNLTSLETPATVAVLSGDDIRNFGYQSLIEAQTRAPGITSVPFSGNGNNSVSARGFYGPNSISQLYDGYQLYNGGGVNTFPFDPWNVERVEVLYGPASILYGTGFIGGAINVVPKKPDPNQRIIQGQASYGSFDTKHLAVDVNAPLNEALAFRVNASWYDSDGYVDRGESESLAVSASLRWQPTPDLVFILSNDFGDIQPSTYEGTPTLGGEVIKALRRRNYNVEDAKIRFRENRTYLRTEWAASENLSFTNDLYHIDHDRRYQEVYTFAIVPSTAKVRRTQYRDIFGYQEQWGDHGFLTWKAELGGGLRNELVVGFDVNRATYDRYDNTNAAGSFPTGGDLVDAFNPTPGRFAPLGTPATYNYRVVLNQRAFFFQDRLILNDKFSLIASGRHDRYATRRTDERSAARTQSKGVVSGESYSLGAVYNPTPDTSLYLQYAVASDPATSLASIGTAQQDLSLSKGEQWEAGAKAVLLDGKVEGTVSVYRIVKKDLLTPIPGATLQEQVGQQSSRGVEASLTVRPAPGLVIDANGAYVDAQFDDFNTGSGASLRSLKGYRPQFVPKTTANLRATYAFAEDWQVRGGVHYVGTRYSDNANTFRLPEYSVVELGASWSATPRAKLDLRIDNAFDKIYAASTYAGNTSQIILGAPRSVTAAINLAF